MSRINPFQPNSAVSPGMFVGRVPQIQTLETALIQTKNGNPKSFMLTGERGIGKTSLLQLFKWTAQGHISIDGEFVHYLVLDLDIDANTTDVGLIRRAEAAIRRELARTEKARTLLTTCWEFLQRLEAMGVGLKERAREIDSEVLHDEFAYSLAETTQRITGPDAGEIFTARFDGVVLLLDEADNAPKQLRLGAFLKLLAERLTRHGCSRVMFGLAGMPALRDVLRESHESSLRVFDELRLDALSHEEINSVVDAALKKANEINKEKTSIDDDARSALAALSEGYPHFIQQFGYSAFDHDKDGTISADDVWESAFGSAGALEKIGDRYYRDTFYNKIQKDSYRQVLRIMAEKSNSWITKAEIRAAFRGKDSTLDNAIHALRGRKIVVSKEGERGTYRLQQKGFAAWIKLHTTDAGEVQSQIEQATA